MTARPVRSRRCAVQPHPDSLEPPSGTGRARAVARALISRPKLLILDEPTRGIDIGAKAEIEKLIAELATKGVATILISSELEEITRNSTRVLVLRDRKQITELDGAWLEPSDVMRVIAGSDGSAQENTDA